MPYTDGMMEIKNHGVVLRAGEKFFESKAVLNPGCLFIDDTLHMVYRAVAPGNYSSLGYAQFSNNELVYRAAEPILKIEAAIEQHGLEDPRLVRCEGIYYLFYTVYDGADVQVAYATSSNLPHFTKRSIISSKLTYNEVGPICADTNIDDLYGGFCKPVKAEAWRDSLLWEKDSFIFPKKIQGKFAMLYRFSPGIQILYFNDFSDLTSDYWLKNLQNLRQETVLLPKFQFEEMFLGGGCPPIETEKGWLLIYHAVSHQNGSRVYQAGVALLDLADPTKILGRLHEPLFSPEHVWEQEGDVPNVVFPTGAVVQDGRLYIYYGAADSCIACCSLNLVNLLEVLLK